MTDHEKTDLEQNLTSRSTWMRLIYIVLFAIIFWLATPILAVVVVLQFLNVLITGQRNDNLRPFGRQLAIYFRQIIDFLCYSDEHHPFPFGEWPGVDSDNMKPAGKPAAKKKTTKKKAAK